MMTNCKKVRKQRLHSSSGIPGSCQRLQKRCLTGLIPASPHLWQCWQLHHRGDDDSGGGGGGGIDRFVELCYFCFCPISRLKNVLTSKIFAFAHQTLRTAWHLMINTWVKCKSYKGPKLKTTTHSISRKDTSQGPRPTEVWLKRGTCPGRHCTRDASAF